MRALHTVSSIAMETSGVTYVVINLSQALTTQGVGVDLFSLGDESDEFRKGYHDRRFRTDLDWPVSLSKLGASSAMRRTILASNFSVAHTHGLWMMPNIYPAEAARRLGKPFVLSPHGMLSSRALQYSRMKKRLFWAFLQGPAVKAVSCFHATASSEYEEIRAFGLRQPVAIIPNGIDLPILAEISVEEEPPRPPFILSLGRIHPKKGLNRLVAAFGLVAQDYPEWQLRIQGPDEGGHAAELERQAAELGLSSRITIEPAVFGCDKFRLMRRAQVFALATLNENFAMTVAESLAVETPVISTKGAPWAGLVKNGCGWWINHGPEPMAAALREAMAMSPEARRTMGARGREWMKSEFEWDGIGAKMVQVYRWLIEGGTAPAYVRID